MSELSVRIIKSNSCWICQKYIPQMKNSGLEFEIFDGDLPENIPLLDKWKVDAFPVIQIVDKNKEIIYQFPHGPFSVRSIRFKVDEQKKKINEAKSGTNQSN